MGNFQTARPRRRVGAPPSRPIESGGFSVISTISSSFVNYHSLLQQSKRKPGEKLPSIPPQGPRVLRTPALHRRFSSDISYCRNHASGQGCPSYGSINFPPHPYIRGRMPLLRLDGWFPLHILTFAAGCRSYGSMVALPFLLIPLAPPPPCAFSPVIPACPESGCLCSG